MNSTKIIAGLAIAGGLAVGALGVGTGVANADPGHGGPIPTRWGPPPPPGPGYGGPGPVGWGPPPGAGYGGPGPVGWGPPPPPPYYGGGGYGDGPIPGGWNGGWEPQGGFCLGPFCV